MEDDDVKCATTVFCIQSVLSGLAHVDLSNEAARKKLSKTIR